MCFRPQHAMAPYMLNASPLAGRCDIREETASMVVSTRVAKQWNTRKFFIFDEKLGDFVLRRSGNGLQSRSSVQMYNGGDFVPPFCSCLMIKEHVRVRRSRAENVRGTILQTYRSHRPEVFAKSDIVEMILHSRRRRGCKNASTTQCRMPKLSPVGKDNQRLVAGENGRKFTHATRRSVPSGRHIARLQGWTATD